MQYHKFITCRIGKYRSILICKKAHLGNLEEMEYIEAVVQREYEFIQQHGDKVLNPLDHGIRSMVLMLVANY